MTRQQIIDRINAGEVVSIFTRNGSILLKNVADVPSQAVLDADLGDADLLNSSLLIVGEYVVPHYRQGNEPDYTAAIDRAIAAMTAAGGGVLVFPFGLVDTAGGHVITVPCKIRGQGVGFYHDDFVAGYFYEGNGVTTIRTSSATAFVFTFATPYAEVENLTVQCTAAVPTAGGGFRCEGSGIAKKASRFQFRNVALIDGFYGVEHVVGAYSVFDNVNCCGQRKYSLYMRNDDNADWGDCIIRGCFFTGNTQHGSDPTDAAIRFESGGGLKVVNNKFVDGSIVHAVHGVIGDGVLTGQLYIFGNSFDGMSGNCVRMETAGTGQFSHVMIADNFMVSAVESIYFNNGGLALLYPSIDHCHFIGSDATKPLIRATGNGGVIITVGTVMATGTFLTLFQGGAGDNMLGGFRDTQDGVFTAASAIGTSGPNAAVVLKSRDGSAFGHTLVSDSAAAGFRVYDLSTGSNVFKIDGNKNVTFYGDVTYPGALNAGTVRANVVDLGPNAGTTAGSVNNLKLVVYDDGSPNKFGIGISIGQMDYYACPGGHHAFYTEGVGQLLRFGPNGFGFNGAAEQARPTITGSRGGNVALANLINKLALYGLITDGTTA